MITEDNPKYQDYNICPVCGGSNTIEKVDDIGHIICEANTICTKCKHEDYWAYGFYNREI